MTEQFALQYAITRQQQLGATGYDLSYQHLMLKPQFKQPLNAQGQMWLIVEADEGIRVESDTGQYYPISTKIQSHAHEHTGHLVVQNMRAVNQQVRFVVVTWRYSGAITPLAAPPK